MTNLFKPTESELEILCILWDKENATVKEVHEVVQKTKEVGYTTTLKLMQIMNTKGLVSRNIQSKKHIYTPTLKKEKAQEQYLNKMVQTLFSGSTAQLVLQALGKHKTSDQDLFEFSLMMEKLAIN